MPLPITLGPLEQTLPMNIDRQGLRGAANYEIANSSQFNRGWQSADIGEDANSLMWKANEAAVSGDLQTAAILKQQGTDLMRQAQQWAPTVRDMTDINSVGSAVDWAGGAMGNLRSSVKPALGGLAGAAVGGLGGALIGGVPGAAAGMNWGSRVGAGLAGYNTMTEGNAADMMMDSGITSTPQEIANAARGAGAVQGVLESVVPAGVAGSVVGLGGRKAAAEIAKNGLLKTAGKRIGLDAAEEFATEFAQNPVGDIAKNYLKGEDLTNIDWKAAVNAGAAGAVGGAGMGAMGAGADALHAQLGKGVDKAKEIKNDPLGAVLDAGVDLAAKAGTAKAKLENYFDERELKKAGLTQDEIDQGRLEQIQATLAGKSDIKSTSPISEEENLMDAPSFNAHHEAKLKDDAATILKAGRDSTDAERDIASKFASGNMDAVEFQTRLHQVQQEKAAAKQTDDFLTGLGQKSKKSMMRPTLTDDLGEQEGRAMTNDTVTDNFGNSAGSQGVMRNLVEPSPKFQPSQNTAAPTDPYVDAGRGILPNDDLTPSDRMYMESELLKPEAQQQKFNTLTDILVKQGVDEKIIHATNGEHNRKQLAGLLKWVVDGTDDSPEAVEAIVNRFGENSGAMFKKAYGLAKNNGLIKPHNEFAEEFTRRLDDASNVQSKLQKALKNNLSDIALHGVKDVEGTIKKLVPMMQTVVQEGMTPKVKQALIDNFFGTEERLHNVMNAYIDTGAHKKLVSKATGGGKEEVEIDAEGNIVAPQQFDEDGELIVDKYGAGASVSEIKGPTIVGFTNPKGRPGIPFNLGFDKGIEKFEKIKAQHSSEMGNSVVAAGIWSRTKADLGNDAKAIEQAGYDILESFGPKLMPEGRFASLIKNFSEGGIDIGDLTPRQRGALLGRIDRQFKYLEVTRPDSGDSKHNIQDVDSFKWDPNDAKPATFTVQKGIIFLERKGSKGVSNFPVKTIAFFKQGLLTEKDGTNGSTLEGKRRGALGTSDLVMSGLTDLMLAEGGNFTGRIGYRTEEGATLQWIEKAEHHKIVPADVKASLFSKVRSADKGKVYEKPMGKNVLLERLPNELKLGQYFTVGDAKEQADIERREEKPTDAGINYAENHKERVKALIELADRDSTSDKFAFMIRKTLTQGSSAILQLYRQLRDQWQGSPEGFGGTPMAAKDTTFAQPTTEYDTERTTEMRRSSQKEGVPAPSSAQGRIEAEDGELTVSDAEYTGGQLVKFPKEKQLVRLEEKYRDAVTGAGPALSKAQSDTLKQLRAEELEHLKKYQKSSTKGKKEVERGPDGARVGLGADAAGAGYGGPGSTRSREGTKEDPHVLPSTHEVAKAKKESAQPKAEDKLENVKDRIVAALQKSVASLMSGRATLSLKDRKIFDIAILGTTRMNKTAEYVSGVEQHSSGVRSPITKYVGDRYEEEHTIGLAEMSVDKLAALYTLDNAAAAKLKIKLGNAADLISGKISSLEEANADNSSGSGQSPAVGGSIGNSSGAANDSAGNSPVPGVAAQQAVSVKESSASGYAERTKHNANSADVTIAFAIDHTTAGERLTARLAGNKLVKFESSLKEFAEAIIAKLKSVNGTSINVAGNGIYTWAKSGGTQEAINQRMFKVLKMVKEQHPALNKIVTGGQTGSDLAGAIAAKALGIPVEVTMPKGFLQRGADGKDFTQTQAAVIKQIEDGAAALSTPKVEAHVLPMSYKIHNLADIRPELRSKYRQGAGIAELIGNGDRTATTRAVPTGVKVGSIIRFPGVEGMYKVTSIEKIDLNSKEGVEAWSKKEGWDTSMVKGFGNQVRHGATQITFERIKNSAQRPGANPKNKEEFEASVAQAAAHIIFTIGKNIKVDFEKMTDGSGSWTEGQTVNTIKLALNGDVLGAAFHESFHEFMNILKKNGGGKTSDVLKRAAMNPIIQRKLEILLNGHPEAIKQLADPEEAAAFMYQFWSAGLLKIGPDTKSAFTTVKNFLKRVAAVFSEIFRKEVEAMSREQMEAGHAEQLLREFAGGAVSNMDTRKMIVEAMEKSTELHAAAVERVGETFQKFANTAGRLVMSSEAMMEATGNKHMVDIVRGFHQKVGTAMQKVGKSVGSYSDGLRQATSHWVHKVEAVLDGYTAEEIEMAREAMSKEIEPTDRVAKELVAKINAFYAEMAQYMEAKDVRRLNMERTDPKTGTRGAWEKIPLRKNYLPQVWSIDALMKDFPAFKADLLKHHMKELQNIADEANKELKDMKGVKKGTAAGIELDRAKQEFKDSGKVMAKLNLQTITPEMVADAIGTRLLASNGHIEINESNSGLGITPAASAVNKRELNWLNKEVFDKYKEKDLTSIMTTYAHSIVKRGEYQSRFGHGGEKIAEGADKAILHELGGDALVDKAVAGLPNAIEKWKKAKAKADGDFDEPFPTLRSVGQKMHLDKVGKEKHDEALLKTMKKLENGFNAIQALEGTLGRDITPNARAVNSWIVTYQSFRTLSTMLFTSFQDVAGIVVNGGEARDAWDGFVEGIREVRNTVFNKKDPSAAVQAAEFWGTVDSGAYLESTAQAQGSPFMSGKAKQWSDTFFKYTGAVGWNRGVRSVATKVAERIITEWKTNGIDTKDKAAVARLEDLFGKGFDPANIKTNPDGTLDRNDLANQAAVTRWVLTAVPAPTAAHRTIWMSDPHYAVFAQLKNYTYSFHRIMMKNAADQARLGNYRPVMAMMLGYAPIAIAAGAIKEMLIPGEEPPWMKGGLDGYLNYGFSRAGVLGVPQMFLGSVIDVSEVPGLNLGKAGSAFDPAALAGPTVDQVQNILSVPFGEFMAMRDHTIIGEGLGALPGGNVLKRIERLGSA